MQVSLVDDDGNETFIGLSKFTANDGVGSRAQKYVDFYPYNNATKFQFDGYFEGNSLFNYVFKFNITGNNLNVFVEGNAIQSGLQYLGNELYTGRTYVANTFELSNTAITAINFYFGTQSDNGGTTKLVINTASSQNIAGVNLNEFNAYREERNNNWLEDITNILSGIYTFITTLSQNIFSLMQGLLPLLGAIFFFWLLDAVITSIHETSIEPIGAAFKYIWQILLSAGQMIMSFFEAVANLIPF